MDRIHRILHKPFYSFWEKYQAQTKTHRLYLVN